MKRLILLITVAAFAFLISGAAFGDILQVPSVEYETIQAGIDAASPGDTVQVAAGTYSENITMISGVVIQGAGQGVSIIDGDGSGYVVTANSVDSAAKLDGFTIRNGFSGGMYNNLSSPTVTNCTFSSPGSGLMFNYFSSPLVTNCTFSGGGGMNNVWFSSPTVTNCIFSGNSASNGGGMHNEQSSSPTVTNCTFSGNHAASGGGMSNESSHPVVTNCSFTDNTATYEGGGMYNSSSSPTVTNCIFSGNSASTGAPGMHNSSSPTTVTVTNCIFFHNYGGCQYCSAIYNGGSPLTVNNCTFSKNGNSSGDVGGIYILGSSVTMRNSILWGDYSLSGEEILISGATSSFSATYSDIQGGYAGTGNINADPMFVDQANGDLHLQQGSPCIDAGDNSAPALPATDIDGDNRRINNPMVVDTGNGTPPIVDMGADEYAWKVKSIPAIPSLLLNGDN